MNRTLNNFLLENIIDEGVADYREKIESIEWDFNNICHLYDFCICDGKFSGDVINGIMDYLMEKFDCNEEKETLKIDFIKPLTDYHYENFDKVLKKFYKSFNDVENAYALIIINAKNDPSKYIYDLLDKLGELRVVAIETSDFFLNYCAIHYLRQCLRDKIDSNFIENNKIKFDFCSFIEILRIIDEMSNVLCKLGELISIYRDKDYTGENKISMYDTRKITSIMVRKASTKSTEALKWMTKHAVDFNVLELTIYLESYYLALFENLLAKTKYKNNIENHLKVLLRYYADEVATAIEENNLIEVYKVDNEKIYSKMMKAYKTAKHIFSENDCVESGKKVVTLLRKEFIEKVGFLEEKTFHMFYVSILCEIRDQIGE